MASWKKISLQIPQGLVEEFSDLLTELGALAVTLEASNSEELFEPPPGTTPFWQKTQLHALFDEGFDLQPTLSELKTLAFQNNLEEGHVTYLADQDWQKLCQDAFQPVCFANKLWIQPSWKAAEKTTDAAYVTLDPGLAFGTGSHPTTALCLEWLAENIRLGDEVIDYGSGSGILAIAALKLGAKKVWAVDNDPQALESTFENAKRNHVQSSLEISLPENFPAGVQADVLIANILANPLIELAPKLISLLKPNGKLVLSGILEEQAEQVMRSYSPNLRFLPVISREGWVRLEGRCL